MNGPGVTRFEDLQLNMNKELLITGAGTLQSVTPAALETLIHAGLSMQPVRADGQESMISAELSQNRKRSGVISVFYVLFSLESPEFRLDECRP